MDLNHNPFIMETRLSLNKSIRNQESKKKWNLEELKEEKTRRNFYEEVNEMLNKCTTNPATIEDKWKNQKEVITKTADKKLGKLKNNLIKPWISKELIELMDIRRKYKNSETVERQN